VLLDSILPRMVRRNSLSIQLRPHHYLRQYVGFESGGQRLVYVHGFHEVLLRRYSDPGRGFDWQSVLVAPCDGGGAVFGVVFDPRTATFGELGFSFSYNGPVRY
jgi:hypothetical protein